MEEVVETQKRQKLSNEDKIRYGIIAFFVLLVVTVLAWILISIFKPATLTISPTNISLDDGIAVHDDKIIAYNGSSFIEISPSDNSVKTIYTPQTRFPSVKNMIYAPNHGILLTFSGNILETPVFDYKIAHDTYSESVGVTEEDYESSLTSGNNYTWFLDFKTNKLTHVMDEDIDSRLVYYNPDDQMFYFTIGDSHDGYNDIQSYDIKTHKIKTVTDKLKFTTVTSIDKCGDSTCLIGNNDDSINKSVIAKVTADGKVSIIKEVDGEILPTPDAITFAYLTNQLEKSSDSDEYDAEDDTSVHADVTTYQNLEIANIETNQSSDYDGEFQAGGSIGEYDDNYFFMGSTSDTYHYFKKSSKDITFNYDNDEYSFDEGFLNIGPTGKDFSLIADIDREVYIVSKQSRFDVFDKADSEVVSKNITTCADKVNDDIQVRDQDDVTADFDVDFELMIPDDDNFNKTIHKVNQCIGKDTANLIGYSYMFTGVSPLNGKITTE